MDAPRSSRPLDRVRTLIHRKDMSLASEKGHLGSIRLGNPHYSDRLRLSATLRFRIEDIDPTRRQVNVEDGKVHKDRAAMPT